MDEPNDDTPSSDDDFALLLEAVDDLSAPKVGELLRGRVMSVDADGAIIGLGLKRDGFVPRSDLERAGKTITPGDQLTAVLISVQGREGHFELSVFQARQNEDWLEAEALRDSGELWVAKVNGYNRGGVIVPFGGLRGFVPASHIVDLPRGISENERQSQLARMVDMEMGLKVIEVDRRRRRLVLSQREAQREWRARRKAELLAVLEEEQVVKGTVSGLREFGAFVDLGGADGLIHVSELAWQRVEYPREVVNVGDEVEVMVIRIDRDRNRIGLSLKRLQPDPWEQVEDKYAVNQELTGRATRLVPFGAFIDLGDGIEGLLHTSEIPSEMADVVQVGAELRLRVANVDAARQRIGLSLRGVKPLETIKPPEPEPVAEPGPEMEYGMPVVEEPFPEPEPADLLFEEDDFSTVETFGPPDQIGDEDESEGR